MLTQGKIMIHRNENIFYPSFHLSLSLMLFLSDFGSQMQLGAKVNVSCFHYYEQKEMKWECEGVYTINEDNSAIFFLRVKL